MFKHAQKGISLMNWVHDWVDKIRITWKFLTDKVEIFRKTFTANFFYLNVKSSSLKIDFRRFSKATLVGSCELFPPIKRFMDCVTFNGISV